MPQLYVQIRELGQNDVSRETNRLVSLPTVGGESLRSGDLWGESMKGGNYTWSNGEGH